MTFTRALATNNYGPSKFIVDGTTVANGTHSTIAAALTSASSGDTIFIRPGTYTENLTLKAGVNLCAYGPSVSLVSDATVPNVIINGTCTFTAAGTVGISGICLKTNGAAALAVTGSSASIVKLNNCFLRCSDTTGISFTSSSASSEIDIVSCGGNLDTTGIALFTHSGAGTLRMLHSSFGNTGSSSTNNTVSGSGNFFPNYSSWSNGTTVSSTASMQGDFLDMTMAGNQTALTYNSTTTGNIQHCTITGNTASAISIGASAGLQLHHCLVSSSNANPITGSGTLTYTDIVFNSVASINNTVLRNPFPSTQGWTYIQTQTASASANLDFLTGITSTFTNYVLVLTDIVGSVGGGAAFQFQYTTNGGSTWANTGYATVVWADSTAYTFHQIISTSTAAALIINSAVFTTSTPGASGRVFLQNLGYLNSHGATYTSQIYSSPGQPDLNHGWGQLGNTAAINGIRVLPASGTFTGTITLYAVIG